MLDRCGPQATQRRTRKYALLRLPYSGSHMLSEQGPPYATSDGEANVYSTFPGKSALRCEQLASCCPGVIHPLTTRRLRAYAIPTCHTYSSVVRSSNAGEGRRTTNATLCQNCLMVFATRSRSPHAGTRGLKGVIRPIRIGRQPSRFVACLHSICEATEQSGPKH